MLITYCWTVRLLARQQQSLCSGGAPVSGGVSTTNGNQTNGWGSGWLGQQNLGMFFSSRKYIFFFVFDWIFENVKSPPTSSLLFVNLEFCLCSVWQNWVIFHRTKVYMATPTENQFTINAESSALSQLNWYRAFKFGRARIMVTRFKVSTFYVGFFFAFATFFRNFDAKIPYAQRCEANILLRTFFESLKD